jgi:hemerythrin
MPSAQQLKDTFEQQYQLGNQQMDAVHREFVNQCVETLACTGGEFARRFQCLFEHTHKHFADEEVQMLSSGYSALAEHRADHQRILGDMDRFNQRIAAGRSAMARAWLNDSLPTWFDIHARTMDSSLVAHLQETAPAAGV